MPVLSRKRRAQSDVHGPESPPQRRRIVQNGTGNALKPGKRPVQQQLEEEEEDEEDEEDVDGAKIDADMGDRKDSYDAAQRDRLVKGLVRLALASEYTRQPIRRSDISSKVLGSDGRMFKEIFGLAQHELQKVFGMKLVELPMREKTKLTQRRAAQTVEKGSGSTHSYILTSMLPAEYKDPTMVEPSGFHEQVYTGLVALVTSLIYLNNRVLPANRLSRYLTRLNAENYTPIDQTEKLLQTMAKHGYIIRVKDNSGGETTYEYHLGPRAKVEIGEDGVKELIRVVYGREVPDDLDIKFRRNVGVDTMAAHIEGDENGDEHDGGSTNARSKKPPATEKRRTRQIRDDDDE